MKKLISVAEIKQAAANQETMIHINSQTLITPAARDAARESGIEFVEESIAVQPAPAIHGASAPMNGSGIDPSLLARIVEEVISCLGNKAADPSGLRLVQGNNVRMDEVPGEPGNRVQRKEIFDGQAAPFPSTGFMSMQRGTLSRDMERGELCYVVQGALTCSVGGREHAGKSGDVFYLPAKQRITFSCTDPVKWFFVAGPEC